MAKILFVLYSEIDKNLVYKTIEEHNQYFDKLLSYEDDTNLEIEFLSYDENLDISRFNTDIIVARGLLALRYKKKYKNISIVNFPVTTDDVISSIRVLQKYNIINDPIALVVGTGDMSYQANRASEIFQIPIIPFDYSKLSLSNVDLSGFLDDLSLKGYKYIIGGLRTVKLASQKGFMSSLLGHGRESLWIALTAAKHAARIQHMERERAAHFKTILNSSREGIISTDVNNNVIYINSSAEKMLELDAGSFIDASLEKIISDPQFMAIMQNKKEYTDELVKLKNNEIVLNKVGISLGNKMTGNVVTLEKISNLQNTKTKIRSKLYHRGLNAKYSFSDIIGESNVLKSTIEKAQTFANVLSNILIIGNSGTGKELFAQSIHNFSSRKNGPFVAVNCAAIPENLIESELFGYAGGAFTGANKEGKQGYFELAHEGTIFLDEVSEIPLNLQVKLLRVIQESEIMRIGANKIIPVDIRIICATNKDLKSLVKEGNFREDLYYRLSVLCLHLPPLHERGQDILLLANHFIQKYSSTFLKHVPVLSPEAESLFLNYPWDGNVRELYNICTQLVVLNATGILSAEEVYAILPSSVGTHRKDYIEPEPISANKTSLQYLQAEKNSALKQAEKKLIMKALAESNYNKTKAALLLSMSRTTLWKKLKEYNINLESFISN
jgi:PAS domain S-box-containing protein